MALRLPKITEAYPLELHYIKALFLAKEFRQCIGACREALRVHGEQADQYPLREAFIQFYLGLAHDEVARSLRAHLRLKIPTFNQAEDFYTRALQCLPASGQDLLDQLPEHGTQDDPLLQTVSHTSHPLQRESSSDYFSSSPSTASPQSYRNRAGETSTRTDVASPGPTTSDDFEDLESHDSFEEIMTPNKVLRRDISRMSLLDRALPREMSSMSLLESRPTFALPRSTSRGLLRPIRLGSPPKPHYLPPRLPYVGPSASRSMMPQLPPLQTAESPSRKSRSSTPRDISPVSPLGPEDMHADDSTVSPVSPETPDHQYDSASAKTRSVYQHHRLDEHIKALREQITTHIRLLQEAKLQATIAQAERAATHSPISTFSSRQFLGSGSGSESGETPTQKRIQQSRSYWSFKTEDAHAIEIRRRVEAGKLRDWKRNRFQPERYRDLAERALAEL